MNFTAANIAFWKNYVKFEGRSSRSEFWWCSFAHTVMFIFIAVALLAYMISAVDPATGELSGVASGLWMTFFFGYFLVTFLPWMSLTVRRFHDQDKSGWMWLINLVFGLIVLIFMCIEGTRGPNKYGEDPLGRSNPDIFD